MLRSSRKCAPSLRFFTVLAHAEKEGIGWKDSSLQEMRGSFGGEQGTCIGSVVFLVTYCFDVTSMSVK